ncbi:MAG: hypothetical protein AAF618_11505 [Pseudomonadota bacterium]
MSNGPLRFPVDDAARERLDALPKRRRRVNAHPPASATVTRHPAYAPEREARIRDEEKARAMPERLMLYILIAVIVLTVTPVALLAFVGY